MSRKVSSFVCGVVMATVFAVDSVALVSAQSNTQSGVSVLEIQSAFQQVQYVTVSDIVVPTVVSVPINPASHTSRTYAVYDDATGEFVASQLFTQTDVIDLVNRAEVESVNVVAARLVDNSRVTSVDFPVSETAESRVVVTLFNNKSEPITADRVQLDLAQHVSLPTTISVRALVDGEMKTVVAPRAVQRSVVTFPETTAATFTIELTYVQPLRINEINLSQGRVVSEASHELRFVAEPGAYYAVYSNPDRSVSLPRVERIQLSSDEDVRLVNATQPEQNIYFVSADVDEDGVRDLLDNCVRVANPDQTDLNGNQKGDACEDFDRDGVLNHVDNCQGDPNRNQSDEDSDGIGDVCDDEESRVTERHAWVPWVGMALALLVIIVLFSIVGLRPKPIEAGESDESNEADTATDTDK